VHTKEHMGGGPFWESTLNFSRKEEGDSKSCALPAVCRLSTAIGRLLKEGMHVTEHSP